MTAFKVQLFFWICCHIPPSMTFRQHPARLPKLLVFSVTSLICLCGLFCKYVLLRLASSVGLCLFAQPFYLFPSLFTLKYVENPLCSFKLVLQVLPLCHEPKLSLSSQLPPFVDFLKSPFFSGCSALFSAVPAILFLSASSTPHLTSNLSSKHMFSLVYTS